jgi:glutaredoxin 3
MQKSSELKLYYTPNCPYCIYVLRYMEQHDISIPLKDTRASSENRQELLDIGGKEQVPCLVIDGRALYESEDIIKWLENN